MAHIRQQPTLLSWSSGKDSAYALHYLQQHNVPVCGLFTTVNRQFQRVAMHGVRRQILELQAQRLGLPLHVIELPWPCSNRDYETCMADFFHAQAAKGITQVAFGDLFLEDVRAYRESQLASFELTPIFPLWQMDTGELSRRLLDEGFRANLTCVDCQQLSATFAGRRYDALLLAELPDGVDPCGERGEFHTLVWDAPNFSSHISLQAGEKVQRERFCYAEFTLPV